MAPTPDQRRCIEETFGVPSVVVAGAGSGKTDTLTRRIVYALEHPELSGVSDIDEILAITYTNKAAGELKSRIKAALEEAATAENGLGLQALKVDGAWISTIHGMGARILRENAFTLGIDPFFAVLADEQYEKLANGAVEEVLEDGKGPAERQAADGLLAEYRRDEVVAMLRQLLDAAAESPLAPQELFQLPPKVNAYEELRALAAVTQEVLGAFEEDASTKALGVTAQKYVDKARDALVRVFALADDQDPLIAAPSPQRDDWLRSRTPQEVLALADSFPKLSGSLKQAKQPLASSGENPKEALAEHALNILLACGNEYLSMLLALLPAVLEAYGRAKQQAGVLDNGDLLALVAKSLTDPSNAALARRYGERFKLVMVDEFQDTNQMQVDMINLIAGGGPGGPSPKLCVVGDAQQSIYRFRNADLSVFKDHVRSVQSAPGGCRIELGHNFRSHGDILAFSKGVFSQVFGEDYLDLLHGRDEERAALDGGYRGAQPNAHASEPRRVNVSVFGAKGAREASWQAARSIAQDFKALVAKGHRPGDMAVLLGTMTQAQVYAQALQEAGLPCAITGGTVFRQSPQAQLIGALLFALTDMRDTQALISVLTSDLFALEAQDLLMLTSLDGKRRARLGDAFGLVARGAREAELSFGDGPGPKLSALLTSALGVLGRAAGSVGAKPMSELVKDVLVESGWLTRLTSEDEAQAADAFKALRIVQALERDGICGPLSLARRYQARLQTAKEAPGVLSAGGSDFVRIMTIHASKGLSLPIVAVSEAEFSFRNHSKLHSASVGTQRFVALLPGASVEGLSGSGLVNSAAKDFSDVQNGPDSAERDEAVLRAPASAARFLTALDQLNHYGELEEHQRKLYVAFTRSKEALFVALRKTGKNPKERQDGRPGTVSAIATLLLGEEGTAVFADPQELLQQVVNIHTDYPAAPEHSLDWQVRLQVFPPAEEGEGQEGTAFEQVASTPFTLPAWAPVSSIGLQAGKAQWSQGILSASAVIAAAGGEPSAASGEGPSFAEEHQAQGMPGAFLPLDDEDVPEASATERGTAFHGLCQWAADRWRPGEALAMPPQERIDAMARLFGLSQRQAQELPVLLERWLASKPAAFAAQHRNLSAEQPFWVELQKADAATGRAPLILQGFIDLLAYDEPGRGAAYVVDYKTGCHLQSDEARREAYGLQAACYAYGLLRQGFEDVTLDFVFVDQPCATDPSQLTVTRFPAPGDEPYTLEGARALICQALAG